MPSGGFKVGGTTLPATAKAATSKLMKEKQKAQRPRERFFAAAAAPCWPAEAPKAFFFGDAIRCWIERLRHVDHAVRMRVAFAAALPWLLA